MSKGLKGSSISPPCMSPPITRKPTVSCGICRVRHLIVDSPILSQGIDTLTSQAKQRYIRTPNHAHPKPRRSEYESDCR